MSKPKTAIISLVVLAILVAVLWLALRPKTSQPPATTTSQQPAASSLNTPIPVTKTEVPDNTLPVGFPNDIPLEAGAAVTQNYNASSPGLNQATRVFTSQKSLAQNFQLYSSYLAQAGWTMKATLNNSTIKVLSATKGNGNLEITITPLGTSSCSVSISYSSQG